MAEMERVKPNIPSKYQKTSPICKSPVILARLFNIPVDLTRVLNVAFPVCAAAAQPLPSA